MSEKATSSQQQQQQQAAAQLNIPTRRSSSAPSNGVESRCLIAAIVYLALLLDNVLLTVIGKFR